MAIGKQLDALLKARGKRPGTFAAENGISKSTIYAIIKRDNEKVDMKTLGKIADALHVSIDYFFMSDAPIDESNTVALPSNVLPISSLHTQRVPMLGAIAAGEPIYADEDYEAYVDAPIHCDFALTVQGDSMEPTYLSGDIVYIRQQDDVDDGQVAAVAIDGEATLKHVYHIPNGVQLVSDNMRYRPMTYTLPDCDNIRILGIVMGYTRMYKANTHRP